MSKISIHEINIKKKNKNDTYNFKQIDNDKKTKIIIESKEHGFISFNLKSKYKILINNKITKNTFINLKNKIVIKCLSQSNNYIKIKNLNFFSMYEFHSFNFDNYRNNYDDLKKLNNHMLWCHWCQFGKYENRIHTQNIQTINGIVSSENNNNSLIKNNDVQIEKDFNWEQYVENYKDLREAGITTKEKAIEHWIYNGRKEGRKYHIYDMMYFKKIYTNDIFNTKITLKNIKNLGTILTTSSIEEKNVLVTKHYNKINFNPEKIDIEYLKYVENFILIIDFYNGGGGTTQFINYIVSKYKMNNVLLIARNYSNKIIFTINDEYEINTTFDTLTANEFLKKNNNKIEKIFINHTLGHDIIFLNKLLELNKKISTITHDFYLINDIPNPPIHNIDKKYTNTNKLNINVFDDIITQNEKNLLIIQDHITNKNITITITDLPDYKKSLNLIETSNDKIVIGILGAISNIKGLHVLKDIINHYKNNNSVEIIVFGLCGISNFKNQHIYHSIEELNDLLIKFKPNILIELSIWPETYSYTLSLKMITKLPIIYLKKTGNFVIEDRLTKYDKAHSFETLEEFDELVKKHKQNYFYTIEPIIYFNEFWDKYFNSSKTKKITNKNSVYKKNINIYPIYFPQFHIIKENNISFYDGYTDIKNLKSLSKIIETETPNLEEFKLSCIDDYDLENINLIQKQIDLLYDYNLSGFALYYYWFSINTITNSNMIMEKVVNLFFSNKLNLKNKKVFFIWANESWSGNPAFGNSNHKIENIYSEFYLIKNINNLMKYFLNKNYLKINNKPLLLIYHEWFMTMEEIKLFKKILNIKCIENNFDGIELIVNSMNNNNITDFDTFYLNFNYKKSNSCFIKNNQIYLDYKKYIDEYKNKNLSNKIETLVFDFDNRARLYKPNKINLSTICINNNLFNKIIFMKSILDKYDNSNSNNILLFNAWNEWGEKMTLEPSNENKFLNLNTLINFFKL